MSDMIDDDKDENPSINNEEDNPDIEATTVMSGHTLDRKLQELKMLSPALILLIGPLQMIGRQWILNKPEMLIGRGITSDIFVGERSISHTHCKVILNSDDNKVLLEDLNSTNGTTINGEKIQPQECYHLKDQDKIKVGNAIFKYVEESSPEVMAYKRNQMDDLTNIYNKSALISNGQEAFQKAKKLSLDLAVIVFDLDNFKHVNDNYGHLAGDFLLKQIAFLVKNQIIRSEDFFARFGGEEFCIVFFNKNMQEVLKIAERIRHIIASHEFKYQESIIPNITVSIGLALLDPAIESWEDLFEKADKAVYHSKRSGKNRVSVG